MMIAITTPEMMVPQMLSSGFIDISPCAGGSQTTSAIAETSDGGGYYRFPAESANFVIFLPFATRPQIPRASFNRPEIQAHWPLDSIPPFRFPCSLNRAGAPIQLIKKSTLTTSTIPPQPADIPLPESLTESIGASPALVPRPDWALFLDFDGTLVELAPTPDGIHPDPALAAILERVGTALDSALAVISGRRIEEIDHWLGASVKAVAGAHGIERRGADGRIATAICAAGEETRAARERFRALADARSDEGVLFEDKGDCLALHYRRAPERRDECVTTANEFAGPALEVLEGSMVVELRPRGAHKGAAVAAFMRDPPFAGRRPVFAGDDRTDEDGFRAVNEMGGLSILVGPERETNAHARLAGVRDMLAWLRALPDRVAAPAPPHSS